MSVEDKGQIIDWVDEACEGSARQHLARNIVGVSLRALQRRKVADSLVDRRQTISKYPANKLTALERNRILTIVNSQKYAHLPP